MKFSGRICLMCSNLEFMKLLAGLSMGWFVVIHQAHSLPQKRLSLSLLVQRERITSCEMEVL